MDQFTPAVLVYALLSLALVRMLPVALALAGSGMSPATVLFMGWFGPRGLASIVLGVVYLEREVELAGESMISHAVMATVLLSIFAHGLTALPAYPALRQADCAAGRGLSRTSGRSTRKRSRSDPPSFALTWRSTLSSASTPSLMLVRSAADATVDNDRIRMVLHAVGEYQ